MLPRLNEPVAARLRRWRADPMRFLEDVLPGYTRKLDPWQREDLEAAFRFPGNVWFERPRGHSKTTDAAAVALAQLLLGEPGQRIYFAATDQDQAGLAFDSLRRFVLSSPLLRESVRLLGRSALVEPLDSSLEVLAADAASSWGLRPTLVVVDELEAWRGDRAEEFFQALVSSLGKRPGARMIVASTAGWDRTSLCWRLREVAVGDPAWLFLRRGQCASWVSREFLEQQRRILPEHVFRMLHLNEWTDAGGAFLTAAEVDQLFSHGLEPRWRCELGLHFAGLDVGLAHDATAVAILHKADDGALEADWVEVWVGRRGERVDLTMVEEWLLAASKRYTRLRVLADPWQAVQLVQRLRSAGVTIEDRPLTAEFRRRLYMNLLELVRERRLRLPPHDRLREELLGLQFNERTARVDHPSGGHDDAVMALALAAMEAAKPSQLQVWIDAMRLIAQREGIPL